MAFFSSKEERLFKAIQDNNLGIVQRLIAKNVDTNAKDKNGWPALVDAAYYGRKEVAEALIKAGANLDLRDNDGDTALICAVCYEDQHTIRMLLDAGAKIDVKNKEGVGPLDIARDEENDEIVQILETAIAERQAAAQEVERARRKKEMSDAVTSITAQLQDPSRRVKAPVLKRRDKSKKPPRKTLK